MNAPQVEEWGPSMWAIFHMLAERTGKYDKKPQVIEETNCWVAFINTLRRCLPCPVCRSHFNEYIMRNNIGPVFESVGSERKERLRKWFFDFHNSVRQMKGQSVDFSFDQLTNKYLEESGIVEILHHKEIIVDNMKRGMHLQWHTREDMLRFLRALETLWILTSQ